tara:strand:- start:549 stop:1079 length:531 start_codon:yes stop_codon:yes gene_type:complete
MYTQITNPMTNRKVSIFSKTGQKILNGYVSNLFGGANTDVSLDGNAADMFNDESDKQPNVEPVPEPVVDAMAPTEDVPALLKELTERIQEATQKITQLTSELVSCKAASGDSSTLIEELNLKIKTLQEEAGVAAETAVKESEKYAELKAQENALVASVQSAIENIKATSETVTSEP